MGITSAQPRRGPSQSVPPAPNGDSQFPIQSTPKFQQSMSTTNGPSGVDHGVSHSQRAIPVSEVYFDMIKDDEDGGADSDDDDDDADYQGGGLHSSRMPFNSLPCPPTVQDMNTGAIFHIVDNPVYCNDLPRPKVGPLTPLELAEYERCGIELRRPKPQPLPCLPVPPPRMRPPCKARKIKCKSYITVEPNDQYAVPVAGRRPRSRSLSRPPRPPPPEIDSRPVPLVRRSAYDCLTAYEIDYARKIFNRIACPDDNKVSFSGFLKLCRRMSPRLSQQRYFSHRAAYHFRLADSDCDGRICFQEFLFAYVQAREAAASGSMGALDSGCSMNERPLTPRPRSCVRPAPCPPPRRRKCRYKCVPVPVTRYRPEYLSDIDRETIPLQDLAKRINHIYDI